MFIGWVYFAAAWGSLFVINGIIDFMLTPGDWLATGNFWDGFFNPTFWSSLWLRTGICIMLAGIYALLVISRYKADDFKGKLVRYNTIWALIGLAIMAPTFYWYWNAIPTSVTSAALEMMATPITAVHLSFWFAGAIAVILIVFGLLIPKSYHMVIGVVVMALGLGWFGGYEWMRESIRKPFVIYDYMYGNAIEVAHTETYQNEGYLSQMVFRTSVDEADLYRRACRSCHTMNGYKPLKPAYDGTDEAFITATIMGAHVLKGNMPPFLGTEEEAGMIASHIYKQIDKRHISEIYNLQGVELGKKVYEIRCGRCHVFGGYSDKSESLIGLEESDYNDILDMAGDLGEEMPDFTGDDAERKALIEYLMSLEKGGAQ